MPVPAALRAINRFESLQVADVMTRSPVTVSSDDTMSAAARVMREHHVSAAPVVDQSGRLAGILSAADFVKREAARGDAKRLAPASDSVADYMTVAVQTVLPGTPLVKAAAMLDAEHIHRLVVLDVHDQIIGVVSTMDIVSALLGIVDEMSALRDRRALA